MAFILQNVFEPISDWTYCEVHLESRCWTSRFHLENWKAIKSPCFKSFERGREFWKGCRIGETLGFERVQTKLQGWVFWLCEMWNILASNYQFGCMILLPDIFITLFFKYRVKLDWAFDLEKQREIQLCHKLNSKSHQQGTKMTRGPIVLRLRHSQLIYYDNSDVSVLEFTLLE